MASVRARRVAESNIWPGFVDAMTALLLILIFVLSIFMIVQMVLRDTVTGQEKELQGLSAQVADLAGALGLEQQRAEGLQDEIGLLDAQLGEALTEAEVQAALVASLTAERDAGLSRIGALEGEVAAEGDRADALNLALAAARDEIDEGVEAARLAAAQREALEAMVARMEAEAANQAAALSEAGRELDAAEAAALTRAAAMVALEQRLAAAESLTAEQAQELERQARELTLAEQARAVELAAAADLRERLKNSSAELTAMTLALEEKRREAEETLTLLAAAEAAKAALETADLDQMSEAERQKVALAEANRLLAEEEALSAESQREVALLNQQTGELRQQLNALQGLLDASAARDAEAQVQIETLGSDLNTALAQVAAEQRKVAAEQRRIAELETAERKRLEEEAKDLRRYRSEFFARVGEVLAGRQGVQVVGDRFVFSSEVLFAPASATLEAAGRAQIAEVAAVIREVADDIPPEIDWILRVDGHTDNIPLTGSGIYADNWSLSQARALSVVRYLVDFEGIPANRLAATGFGEFQPVDPGSSSEALARNRRIELKFTER